MRGGPRYRWPVTLRPAPDTLFRMGCLRWLGRHNKVFTSTTFRPGVFCMIFFKARGWFAACRHSFILGCAWQCSMLS